MGVRFQIVQGWGLGAEYIAVPPYHTPTLTPIHTAIQLKSHPECTIISPDRLPYIIERKDASEDIENYRSTYSALLGQLWNVDFDKFHQIFKSFSLILFLYMYRKHT